mmetsp:Transcript_27229/g.65433  ORF Transcript_27229/g.65433 Transcript_27229/m.65433 type:complete len:245 (+) Transcript_27229:376-1110(+)
MKLLCVKIITAMYVLVGSTDATRLKGRSPNRIAHGDSALPVPQAKARAQAKEESAVDIQRIADLLMAQGIGNVSFDDIASMLELDVQGSKMSSGPARDVCGIILDEVFDLLLFSGAVEDAFKVIICGVEEETAAPTSAPTASPTAAPTASPTSAPTASPGPDPRGGCINIDCAAATIGEGYQQCLDLFQYCVCENTRINDVDDVYPIQKDVTLGTKCCPFGPRNVFFFSSPLDTFGYPCPSVYV